MKSKKKTSRNLFLIILFLLICIGIWLIAFHDREKPLEIQSGTVQKRNITEIVIANGKIHPVTYVKISSEVSGEIINLPIKEGQLVKKGDLLFSIKPDLYIASSNSAVANLESSKGSCDIALSDLKKWESEWKRSEELFKNQLLSKSDYEQISNSYFSAQATYTNSLHQVTVAQAALDRAAEDLSKCTIYSPLDGTISKLNSELGERVVGTGTYTGTEVMTISDLNHMEARVEIGEMDINLIQLGQRVRLEVDAFRDKKFTGTVTQIANTATDTSSNTEATKFEIRILINEKDTFRPGMSVTAEVETRYANNVISVPIQCVTTRSSSTNLIDSGSDSDELLSPKKSAEVKKDTNKIEEIVFIIEGNRVHSRKVIRGISDDNYTEIKEGLQIGEKIVTGGYKAISKDLVDNQLITIKP